MHQTSQIKITKYDSIFKLICQAFYRPLFRLENIKKSPFMGFLSIFMVC